MEDRFQAILDETDDLPTKSVDFLTSRGRLGLRLPGGRALARPQNAGGTESCLFSCPRRSAPKLFSWLCSHGLLARSR